MFNIIASNKAYWHENIVELHLYNKIKINALSLFTTNV